jgi:arginyl-tRNA synthetase
VTLRDLIDWTSRDAVRFFLISRKADTEFTFDVDLALKQNDENPVFYVQYAHARICSVLAQYAAAGRRHRYALAGADLSLLVAPTELALMLKLADYPDMLTAPPTWPRTTWPSTCATWPRRFHSYYAAERFLVDDAALARARAGAAGATAQVLRNALALLGVSAPESMM